MRIFWWKFCCIGGWLYILHVYCYPFDMFVLRIFEPLSSVNLLKGVYKVHKQSVLSFSCGELVHEKNGTLMSVLISDRMNTKKLISTAHLKHIYQMLSSPKPIQVKLDKIAFDFCKKKSWNQCSWKKVFVGKAKSFFVKNFIA